MPTPALDRIANAGLRYTQLPFRFTGTIDKLTFNLGKEQLTAEDQQAKVIAIARASD